LIHFATHAVFRNDNPLFSWMRLADGDLTVHELGELRLPNAPLVVLSACETGRGKARGGGLVGMGRGFLLAGASGLVVSLWKMNDQACAQWMVDFYRHLTNTPATALLQAQRTALREGRSPYFWAGFIFIGG
jgi:CHAT domain-containing protein